VELISIVIVSTVSRREGAHLPSQLNLSLIARALKDYQMGIVASLELSSTFNVVNIDLLLKRLKILGLFNDIIELMAVRLHNR
jgi:hypothetical protein